MTSKATIAHAYMLAQRDETSRLRAKAARLTAQLIASGVEAREATARAALSAASTRDNVQASGRLDAKLRPIVATEYESDPSVKGSLHKLYQRANSDRTRRDEAKRAAVEASDSKAQACQAYRQLRAKYVRGGSAYRACRSRSHRRACDVAVYQADKLAQSGDWTGACQRLINTK